MPNIFSVKKIGILAKMFVLAMCLASCGHHTLEGQNICIEEHDSIIVYYPEYTSLDLIGGSRVPHGDDILYCCGAAFTAKCLKYFTHDNIRCGHVCHGHFHKGSPEPICTGTFTFYNGKGHFAPYNTADLHTAANSNGMGFCQVLVIHNGEVIYSDTTKKTFWIRKDYVFRALCEKDGRLCIVESKEQVFYDTFVRYLVEYGVENAINLDMGGWSHAWFLSNEGEKVETNNGPTRYATNWLVFRK